MNTAALIPGTGDAGGLALGLAFCALLIVVTLTDLDRRVIPNAALAAGAAVAVGVTAATDPNSLGTRAIGAVAAGGFLLVVAIAHPRGMGMGDVKLAAVMGLYLGGAVAAALLIAFGAGTLAGIALVARHGMSARRQTVPFGPFLALGGVVAMWCGNDIAHWYLGAFVNR